MDLENIWQANKRFFVTVGSGLLVFLIGYMIVESAYDDKVKSMRQSLRKNKGDLTNNKRYSEANRVQALDENEALEAAVEQLKAAVAFEPRKEYVVQTMSGGTAAANQYFEAVDRVKENLTTLASRNRLRIPGDLGLETLNTTRPELIERHFEALDVIDRVVRLAVEAGVQRIDKIQVQLDPGLTARHGLGDIERTQVRMTLICGAEEAVRWIGLTQSDRYGKPLAVHDLDVQSAKVKTDEVSLDITFIVVRLNEVEGI